jgi:hypothetical protein
MQDKHTLMGEIRYSERLCQRTARFYRHINASTVFLSVLGGSGVVSTVAGTAPAWLAVVGGLGLAVFGAVNLAMRPSEKAAAADADGKRYAQLRTQAHSMNEDELQTALNKLRESDSQELESLREVAFNDMVTEIGKSSEAIPLKTHQKLMRAFA